MSDSTEGLKFIYLIIFFFISFAIYTFFQLSGFNTLTTAQTPCGSSLEGAALDTEPT
jgi:hypothetical protein